MGLRINNNIAAVNSYRNLAATDKAQSSSLEKLSSGFRINKAADDAAGLVVSEGLRSQINGMTQAARNAQDGVNVAQTADGALSTSTSILQRMRDLAVQASNSGSQDADAKAAANTEFSQLKSELDRISNTTSFGGQKLLDGSYNGSFQIGANNSANDRLNINLGSSVFGPVTAQVNGVPTQYTATAGFAYAAGDKITIADGSKSVTLTVTTTTTNATDLLADLTTGANGTALAGKFNLASTGAANLTVTQPTAGASGAITVGFRKTDNTFGNMTGSVTTAGTDTTYASASGFSSSGLGLQTSNLTGPGSAQTAIAEIDNALKSVSTARASVGAIQNRFEHAINSLNVSIENITASESAIRDTDMAKEMTKFSKSQILSQAGTSMLAQANSSSQNILSLLRG
ncbi:flagellin N-terminal helical domain-containing protein [Kineococcus sp. SYSU DK002]|uniref:flagellin N-terminal helical domain-containing protein n=1 Tax=Kineococcus sp. SYSU DK002 TaxID=3383123 RepID=UPI003D7E8C2B